MATSNPVGRYLGSTKNLVGCLGGLLGVVLHLTGVVGGVWPVVVAALYLAGALVAPPEKVVLAVDPAVAAGRLRADLDTLQAKVHKESARIPAETLARVDRVAEILSGLLARSDLHTDPGAVHDVTRLVRVDVPLAVETYLNLPWWFAVAKRAGGRSAAEELGAQLELLVTDATAVATRFYADDVKKQADHTRYLNERNQE